MNLENRKQYSTTDKSTALMLFRDGTMVYGNGCGREGCVLGELCFNTGMTGYQEVLTDPSYAGQVVVFTFVHIGNTGCNDSDTESFADLVNQENNLGNVGDELVHARAIVLANDITSPSNYRSLRSLVKELENRGMLAITGVDTRSLTRKIRINGMSDVIICHSPSGRFDIADLQAKLDAFKGVDSCDLVAGSAYSNLPCDGSEISVNNDDLSGLLWSYFDKAAQVESVDNCEQLALSFSQGFSQGTFGRQAEIILLDYGVKSSIYAILRHLGCEVRVLPFTSSFEEIMGHDPDGILLSNGPGDPKMYPEVCKETIRKLITEEPNLPILSICLGHQLLALSLGLETRKMKQGHHGFNHPVFNLLDKSVEIVSMNHSFDVEFKESVDIGCDLHLHLEETYRSLFDGSNSGFRIKGRPVFSVQHHPEASPGPQESRKIFEVFADHANRYRVSKVSKMPDFKSEMFDRMPPPSSSSPFIDDRLDNAANDQVKVSAKMIASAK